MTKNWTVFVTASLATLLTAFFPLPFARADIFQWEYINPADPSQGKQQSTTLAPDGAGVDAVPGASFYTRDLTMAYLIGADLTNAWAAQANLTDADLSQANLTNASFSTWSYYDYYLYTDLTGANFTNAQVRGAGFHRSNLSTAQLYSTASYQDHDLSGIVLSGIDLTGVNLAGQNLTNARFNSSNHPFSSYQTNLTNADLSGADVRGAEFTATPLTSANLTGADVRGANFYSSHITAAQLYSTASYQNHDLSGTYLWGIDLTGGNFAGFNLTNATFDGGLLTNANLSQANLTNANVNATLPGANLTGAEVRGAKFYITAAQLYSTASYQDHDLSGTGLYGIDLTGGNFAGFNLTNATFDGGLLTNANLSQANLTNANVNATLTGANLTGAEVRGAKFYPGITAAQLYSTASYQAHDLSGINLSQNDLAGFNFAGQNLTNAYFAGYEYCDEFECFTYPGANFTNANLSGADARGAEFYLATLSGTNTSNLIQSNGHLAGLNLTAGKSLVVRDYDGNPTASPPSGPLPIVVEQQLAMDTTGTLRLVFDADAWDSTISFAPGIPVTLGGTLELTFAPGVDVATQSGRTIDLFDWTGVTPTGAFAISSPYTWNLTNLYTTGEVTLAALPTIPGDFNLDGTVDAADYVVWRKTGGTQAGYNTWRANFGQPSGSGAAAGANATVPEPATALLLMIAAVGWCLRRERAA